MPSISYDACYACITAVPFCILSLGVSQIALGNLLLILSTAKALAIEYDSNPRNTALKPLIMFISLCPDEHPPMIVRNWKEYDSRLDRWFNGVSSHMKYNVLFTYMFLSSISADLSSSVLQSLGQSTSSKVLPGLLMRV